MTPPQLTLAFLLFTLFGFLVIYAYALGSTSALVVLAVGVGFGIATIGRNP